MIELILNPVVVSLMFLVSAMGIIFGCIGNKKKKYDFKFKFESISDSYWVGRTGEKNNGKQ